MEGSRIKIEVWSDIICPFCYIGKRTLEQAIENSGKKEKIEVIWKSFQLDPTLPASPMSSVEYLSSRKGVSAEHALQMTQQVKQMAEERGLIIFPEKGIVANSKLAHRLSHLALQHGKQNEVEEFLFKAHFVEGKNIGDQNTLKEIAKQSGIPSASVDELFASDVFSKDVEADINEATQLGVRSVPFFVFERKYAISGAQSLSAFENTLKKVLDETKSIQ